MTLLREPVPFVLTMQTSSFLQPWLSETALQLVCRGGPPNVCKTVYELLKSQWWARHSLSPSLAENPTLLQETAEQGAGRWGGLWEQSKTWDRGTAEGPLARQPRRPRPARDSVSLVFPLLQRVLPYYRQAVMKPGRDKQSRRGGERCAVDGACEALIPASWELRVSAPFGRANLSFPWALLPANTGCEVHFWHFLFIYLLFLFFLSDHSWALSTFFFFFYPHYCQANSHLRFSNLNLCFSYAACIIFLVPISWCWIIKLWFFSALWPSFLAYLRFM